MRRPWRLALVLGCALLLIFGATLQVAHFHTPADVSHSGCALCATAHVVISPAAPLAVLLAARRTAAPSSISRCLRASIPRFLPIHKTPSGCDCFFLSSLNNPIAKISGGGVRVCARFRDVSSSSFGYFCCHPWPLVSMPSLLPARLQARSQMPQARWCPAPQSRSKTQSVGSPGTAKTDGAGHYQFTNLPFNPYHLAVNAPGFSSFSLDVPVRSTVPVYAHHRAAGGRRFDHCHGYGRRSGGE